MKDLACTDTWRRYKIEILRRAAPQNDILSFAFNRHGNSYRVSWALQIHCHYFVGGFASGACAGAGGFLSGGGLGGALWPHAIDELIKAIIKIRAIDLHIILNPCF